MFQSRTVPRTVPIYNGGERCLEQATKEGTGGTPQLLPPPRCMTTLFLDSCIDTLHFCFLVAVFVYANRISLLLLFFFNVLGAF